MFRLLATDIDDTLLAHDGSLPEVNREVLARLHERGIVIVFVSGRADSSIQRVASRILQPDDDEYYIGFNGARVVTAASRTIVERAYVDQASIRQITAYCASHDLHVQAYEDDSFLFARMPADSRRYADQADAADRYAEATGQAFRIVSDLSDALPDGSPKLLIIADHEELVPHRSALEKLGAGRYTPMFSKPHFLEVVGAGVSKGAALRALASRLEIPIAETLAIGDGDNDAEMIAAAGLGVAVANAREKARAAATVILESDASSGAMAELERRFFA